MARQLAADIAMGPVKPDLFDAPIPALWASPEHRPEHIAGLVQGQRVVAMFYMMAQLMVVKGMSAFRPAPQQWQPQPQRLDRIPGTNHLDLGLGMAMGGVKGLRRLRGSALLVVPVGGANIAHSCMLRL